MKTTLDAFYEMLKEEFQMEPTMKSKVTYENFYPKHSDGCYIETFLMFEVEGGTYIKMLQTVNKFGDDERIYLYTTKDSAPGFYSEMMNLRTSKINDILEKMEELEIDFNELASDVFKVNDRPIPKGSISIIKLIDMHIGVTDLPAITKYMEVEVEQYEFILETRENAIEMSGILNIDAKYLDKYDRVIVTVKYGD